MTNDISLIDSATKVRYYDLHKDGDGIKNALAPTDTTTQGYFGNKFLFLNNPNILFRRFANQPNSKHCPSILRYSITTKYHSKININKGMGIEFTQPTQHVTLPMFTVSPYLSETSAGSLTVAAWIYLTSTPSVDSYIFTILSADVRTFVNYNE